ncbi:MAG: deoxyhypusine synthase family protein [bacterium]
MKNMNMPAERVKSIEVRTPKPISQLLSEMSRTGFQGRKLAEVCEVFVQMIKESNLTIFVGYSGSLSVAGQWKIINWLLENHYVDILVSTGANISEDIVEAMGFSYYQGSHSVDDGMLFSSGLNRYYDIYGSEKEYLEMTELIAEFIQTLEEARKYSSYEFLFLLGRWLSKKGINSIVSTAAENRIPIFCPAIADSPFGDAALIAKANGFDLTIDAIKDYVDFMKLTNRVKNTGVFYIGGGVPKDFIQLFAVTGDLLYKDRKIPNKENLLNRQGTDETYNPHKYAIQITTDSPQWGGLSGCTFEEAISWGKETEKGRFVQCYCDATIALPIIVHATAERVSEKRQRTDFSFIFK